MNTNHLQKNLAKIISEQNLHIADLERKAGLKKNSVYNIIKGISKNPSAQNVFSIAKVLGVSTDALYKETTSKVAFLTKEELNLIVKVNEVIANEIVNSKINVTYVEYIDLISKMFEYNNLNSSSDYKFANWLLLNLKK